MNPINNSATMKPPPAINPVQYQSIDSEDDEEKSSKFPKSFIIKLVISAIVFIIFITVVIIFVASPISNRGGKVTLLYWGLWEDEAVFSEVFANFEREHPNVDIVYEKQDIKTLKKYIERLSSRIQNDKGPDIFRYHVSWLFMIRDLLLPLPADVVSAVELDEKYYDVVKTDLNKNGAYYGVPLGIDTLALFINNDLFQSAGIANPPATWDEFVQVARNLTVQDENGTIITPGAALGIFDNVDHSSDILSLLLVQNGADLTSLAGNQAQNASDALAFYVSFAKGSGKVWDDTFPNSKLAFTQGRLAMYFGYSWDIFEIKRANPNLAFSVVNVPHVSGTDPDRNKTISSYWVEGVSVKSKHSKEAFELLTYLSKKENLEKLYSQASKMRDFGEPYARSDMQKQLSDNELIFPFVKQAENSTSTIFASDTHDDSSLSALNAYLGNAVRSMLLDTSPQSALETLAKGVSDILSSYEQQ